MEKLPGLWIKYRPCEKCVIETKNDLFFTSLCLLMMMLVLYIGDAIYSLNWFISISFSIIWSFWGWWNSWDELEFKGETAVALIYLIFIKFCYSLLDPDKCSWWLIQSIFLYIAEIHAHVDIMFNPLSLWQPVILMFIWRMFGRICRCSTSRLTSYLKSKERILAYENKFSTREKELHHDIHEQRNKFNSWLKEYQSWKDSQSVITIDIETGVTKSEEEMASLCRQREDVRNKIAKLEAENKELAKKIIESEKCKTKLEKKKKKMDACRREKDYAYEIESAKFVDVSQKLYSELNMIMENLKLVKQKNEKKDAKYVRTQQLAKEIEDEERDLECPVCFEICMTPVFMCHLSHQICNQCLTKVKVCPQCREPYRKKKLRHKLKEMRSDHLQLLYKEMKDVLESD